jgi:hypothetical protein
MAGNREPETVNRDKPEWFTVHTITGFWLVTVFGSRFTACIRLNTLINVVERQISEGRNGGPKP